MYIFVDGLPHLGHPHQLPNLIVAQVIQPVPRKVLLLNTTDDVSRKLLELAEWGHGVPPGGGGGGGGGEGGEGEREEGDAQGKISISHNIMIL